MDMICVQGTSHLFFTLSMVDLQWPNLHRHMPNNTHPPPEDERAARQCWQIALNGNPHIAAAYLDERLQIYVKYFLIPLLGVKHFWYCYEWQEHRSGHIHSFLWLNDAPNVEDIDWTLLKDSDAVIPEDQDIKMHQFSTYWAKIVTVTNPFPPEDENAPLIGQHPCTRPREALQNTKQELAELLNWVERHHMCVAGYCQVKRKVPGQAELRIVCCFDYPMEC